MVGIKKIIVISMVVTKEIDMDLDVNKVHGKSEVDGNAITGDIDMRKMAESIVDKVKISGTGIVGELPNQGGTNGSKKEEGGQKD